MDDITANPSRRALLGALSAAPIVAAATSPWHEAIAQLHRRYGDKAVTLVRSKAGRDFSLARYHRAEEFFPEREARSPSDWHHFLYQAGIVAQLSLSSHLLDVGFPDAWCASHIGLRVAKSLVYANATGFGYDCPDTARLALVLTPYWKWNRSTLLDRAPDDGGFTPAEVHRLLRNLLDHVHHVTGHRRPRGWNRDHSRRERLHG